MEGHLAVAIELSTGLDQVRPEQDVCLWTQAEKRRQHLDASRRCVGQWSQSPVDQILNS